MKIEKVFAFVFALVSAAAVASLNAADPVQPYGSQQTQSAPTDMSGNQAAKVLADIHHTNEMEIKCSKIAKDRAQAPAVKTFAEAVIKDHEDAEKRTKELASTLNIKLPDADEAMKKQMDADEKNLKSLKGAEFDRTYTRKMVDDHQKTIDKLTQAQNQLTNAPALQSFISQLLPVLEQHKQTANDLLGRVQGSKQPS